MTKILLFAGLVLTTLLAAAPVFAQSPTPEPVIQVSAFFGTLVEGRVDAAYDELLKGTKIDERPKDVAILKTKTRDAFRVFGDINGYETVDSKDIGTHLRRLTCISIGKSYPIRWRFYFYNPTISVPAKNPPTENNSVWRLIDIRIDDRLMDMFEEPAPAATGAAK